MTSPSPASGAMTPRERWLCLLSGRTPDRIPTDFWATPEFSAKLMAHLGVDSLDAVFERLHIDRPRYVGPAQVTTEHPDIPGADLWGVRYRTVDYGTGTYSEVDGDPPLAHVQSPADLKAMRWPSPDDFDYSPITRALAEDDGTRIIAGGSYEPFLLYCKLRGLEQGFEDLALNPEIVDGVLGRMFDFFFEHNRLIFEAGEGRIDITYVAEDLGGQTAPLIGLPTYQRFLRENQAKMADMARSFGVHIMYHTDGAARIFLPDLIDRVGIEVLNPIQWRCPGMEREGLVRDFGERIAFHGGMDNQYTLPFGSVDEVIAEVHDNLSIFRDARWFCAPCHNIQAVTPPENVVAMYETIHEAGVLS